MSDKGRQSRHSYAARCAILVAAALACPVIGHSKGRVITPTTTGTIASCGTNPTCTPGEFGLSMATNAGTSSVPAGSVVVIGAPATSLGTASDVGVAIVYVEPSAGWGATLPSPTILETPADSATPVGNAQSGFSVAISSDGNTIVVGAPGDNSGYGAAWVFTNPNAPSSIWPSSVTENHELTASDGASGDQFGDSVAISPGGNTIVVGAPDHAVTSPSAISGVGEAYIFTTSNDSWNTTNASTILNPVSASTGENFGTSVAINGDASATSSAIFVGAPSGTATGGASTTGVVDVFNGSSWGTASEIPDPANASNDGFGASVAIAGATAVVGAPNTPGAAGVTSAGAAYVFTGPVAPSTTWSTTPAATLTASGATTGSLLGTSVAISSDDSTIVAGAPGSQGMMYQFDEPAKGPNPVGWSSETESYDLQFSKSVQSNQDDFGASTAVEVVGRNTSVFAGAPYTTSTTGVIDAGAAYIFSK